MGKLRVFGGLGRGEIQGDPADGKRGYHAVPRRLGQAVPVYPRPDPGEQDLIVFSPEGRGGEPQGKAVLRQKVPGGERGEDPAVFSALIMVALVIDDKHGAAHREIRTYVPGERVTRGIHHVDEYVHIRGVLLSAAEKTGHVFSAFGFARHRTPPLHRKRDGWNDDPDPQRRACFA